MKAVKMIFKFLLKIMLIYSIILFCIDGLFSLLSMTPTYSLQILVFEKLVPYIIGILAMLYCAIKI